MQEFYWIKVDDSERIELGDKLRIEGEKQNTINDVLDFSKSLHKSIIDTPDSLRAIINHKFDRPAPIWDAVFPNGQSRTVTIGEFYDRITRLELPFAGDWLNNCQHLYTDFDASKVRIFVGIATEEAMKELGSRYIITDGAHRAIVVLRKFYEDKEFVPIPIYSTVIG